MGLSSSLYAGISGLSTMGNSMSVLGDNVANVNTTAFKSSRATFQDVLSQSIATSAGSAQVGRGVTLTAVDGLFAQGSFESTSTSTDMAIGGEGFFMLRAADSAEAALYTRAGEFRFDTQGNLISPSGHFVQGWAMDSDTGQIQGTIDDIYLGSSTPPVATEQMEVIVNVDSRVDKEITESRLFEAWNGTNPAQSNPTDPIDSANYNYTTAIKVYDSKGAAHDITIYFDRTTQENQWEYLITCDPGVDRRVLDAREQDIYAPNEAYNFETHKGAGALQYGVIDFNTSGAIVAISAWDVPPDGKVDPAQNTNRLVLDNTDGYYKFKANFTGATNDQEIAVNFGARYGGVPTNQTQILVSDRGAYADQNFTATITKETLWADVYDSDGANMADGDLIAWSGYDKNGNAVSSSYRVVGTNKVSDFLTSIGNSFGGTASIDQYGKLRLTDLAGGETPMFVTSFVTSSYNGSDPFGGGTSIASNQAFTSTSILNALGTKITDPSTQLTAINNGVPVAAGDTFTFAGTAVDGTDVTTAANNIFTVVGGDTIQDLLDFIATLYDDGTSANAKSGNVKAFLDTDGQLRIIDSTGAGKFSDISMVFTDITAGVPPVNDATPWGATNTTTNLLTSASSVTGMINVNTTKRELLSPGRALSTDSGNPPVITETTAWNSVFASNGTQVANGDQIVYAGTKRDGTTVRNTYTVDTNDGSTIQKMLDQIEADFDADAFIDVAGRLVVRDRISDSPTDTSGLTFRINSYGGSGATIFGPAASALPLGSSGNLIGGDGTGKTPAMYTDSAGAVPVVAGDTLAGSYDASGRLIAVGDRYTFSGIAAVDGSTAVPATTYTVGAGDTVQTLMTWLDDLFDDGVIDTDGDTAAGDLTMALTAGAIEFTDAGGNGVVINLVSTASASGGSTGFDVIDGDLSEDGSRMGGVVSYNFEREALTSTQYANSSTTIYQDQDGFAAGFLQAVNVNTGGIITGSYSNGQVLQKAKVALANFSNVQGLHKVGGNIFRATTESGAPVTGAPGENGLGSIAPNSLEMSNVDLGTEFVKLITTQRGFQANSKIITTTDEMLNELINIKR